MNGVDIMPWCPNCKNEFQEGIEICSDCKIELVDELPKEEEFIPFFQSEQKSVALKLLKFFEYSKLKSKILFIEENATYVLYIPIEQQRQAKKLYQAFYFVERELQDNKSSNSTPASTAVDDFNKADDDTDQGQESYDVNNSEHGLEEDDNSGQESERDDSYEQNTEDKKSVEASENEESTGVDEILEGRNLEKGDLFETTSTSSIKSGAALYSDFWNKEAPEEPEFDEEEEEVESSATYVMKADRYKDYNATVWVFLLTGIAGIVFVALNVIGVLTLLSGLFPNIIMGTLFVVFVYIGLSSNQKAKSIKLELEDEKKLTDSINHWLEDNVTEEFVTSLHDDTMSEELNYLKITDEIKSKLNEHFGKQNDSYLEQLIEEYYNTNIDVIE